MRHASWIVLLSLSLATVSAVAQEKTLEPGL